MKLLVVALALLAVAASSPVGEYVAPVVVEPVKTLRSVLDQTPEGSYSFGFESEDGITREEVGEVKEVLDEENKPHKVVVVRGSYSYTNKEGKPETVQYYADENGFNAQGDSIPKLLVPVRR